MLVGSQYFFSNYPDFTPHDIDELEIIETTEFKQLRQLSGKFGCIFQLKKQPSKEEYIDWALKSPIGMVIGKFLVPEFCEAIGFTIQDLPRLRVLVDRLDEKHKYEAIIYESYLENNAFVLTDTQRDRAYRSYKNSRLN